MQRSIAATPAPTPAAAGSGTRPAAGSGTRPAAGADTLRRALDPTWIGFAFVVVALVVYVLSHLDRSNFYNHFVWQADAFLRGDVAIPYPSDRGIFGNGYFQDVMPLDRAHGVAEERPGYALLPFPPLPAIILLPFVAVTGLATDMTLISMIVGAINVGLAWRLTVRLTDRLEVAFLATAFFGFGTVAWYAAMLGSTWFFAHTVATTFLLLAITRAIDAEHDEDASVAGGDRASLPPTVRSLVSSLRRGPVAFLRCLRFFVVGSQFRAGLLFGLAGTARLTVMFGAPFFMLVGGGGSLARRAFSAGLGAAIPIGLLLGYNLATTGHIFHPAYHYLYRTEYTPREEFRHLDWGIEDPRYIPQNSVIALLWPPQLYPPHPDADDPVTPRVCSEYDLLALDEECPILKPDPIGMSLFLTSPAYLLAAPLLLAAWRRRLLLGAALATAAVALVNVMHFSQGWVQFGYRFSNDYAPFALVLVTVAIARTGLRAATWGLVIASVIINAWGVYWGIRLGW